MSYRIVRVTSLYDASLKQYYAMFPDYKHRSYGDQYNHLINESCDSAALISRNMKALGVDAIDIFTNAEWLQNQWRIENSCEKSGKELILEQIKKLSPTVLWLDDPQLIDSRWISVVRDNIPTLRIVTGEICAPYDSEDLKNLRMLDFLVTCTPCLRNEFESNGIKTYLVYHAFERSILARLGEQNKYPVNDLLFTGSLYTGGGFHNSRIQYLERFLDADIPVKIYGSIESTRKIFSKKTAFYGINLLRKSGFEKLLDHIPPLKRYEAYGDTPVRFYSRKLKASVLPPVFGIEQFKLLSKAKICFNIHGEVARACAGNLRLFEATGVGACLVTDWKENLGELFEIDKEVVAYKSKEECTEKIKWLLQNPSEVTRIGQAGKARTLKDHTTQNRANQINEILTKLL